MLSKAERRAAIADAEAAAAGVAALTTSIDSNSIDVYIRACNTDICFRVRKTERVLHLYSIFEQLRLLQPSFFCYARPKRFSVSVHPGYLTNQGALLFTDDAAEKQWLKPLRDEALIGEAVADGQLIIPELKVNVGLKTFAWFWMVANVWVFCPNYLPFSTQAPSVVLMLYECVSFLAGLPKAPDLMVRFFNGWEWQTLCFGIAVRNMLYLYKSFSNGNSRPNKMCLFGRKWPLPAIPSQEDLIRAGWTGARRMASEEWIRRWRDKQVNGLDMGSYTGALEMPAGIVLREGEGWNVLAGRDDVSWLRSIEVGSNLLDSSGKFVVSQAYFAALGAPIASVRQEEEPEAVHNAVQQFREFGYDEGPRILTDLFSLVEKLQDEPRKLEV